MRDDIMRLKKNGEDLYNSDKRITPGFNNENESIMQDIDNHLFDEPKSKFRQMYEMKKQKIKTTYDYNQDEVLSN